MKKFLLGAYMSIVASAIIGIITLTMFYAPIENYYSKTQKIQNRADKINIIVSQNTYEEDIDCVSQQDNTIPVGGLGRDDVPRFPGSLRTSYEEGAPQYAIKGNERDVFSYYLPKLATQCWKISALTQDEAVWTKGESSLKIAIAQSPYGGKTIANYYSAQGVVLGVDFSIAQTSCPEGQMYCSDPCGSGVGGCTSATSCPSTCGSGSTSGTTPTCPAAPSGCANGYMYDSQGCPSSCIPTTSSCPTPPSGCSSGFTYDSSGCATGCYTSPGSSTGTTCSGTFTNGTAAYSCNYTTCPNGCVYGSDGCSNGCYTPKTCTGEYQQTGSTYPNCNYSKCPNGCNWGSDGCPSGCYTQTTCTGDYQSPGSTNPICNYAKCPNGCTWGGSGCPTGCMTSNSSCPSGQYWCTASNMCISNSAPCTTTSSCGSGMYSCNGACIPNTSTCSTTGGGTAWPSTQADCTAQGKTWCPSSSTSSSGACYYSGTTCPINCPSGQYSCNGVCKPNTDTNCPWSGNGGTACPADQWTCDGSCISKSSACRGWYSNGTQSPTGGTTTGGTCSSGQYLCNNNCISIGTSCNGYPYYPPGTPAPSSCPVNYNYCSSLYKCIANSETCPSSTVPPAPVACGQCKYNQNGQCMPMKPGTPDAACGSGGVCDPRGSCVKIPYPRKYVSNNDINWGVCGDGFCDKGEDRVNCKIECDNEPPAPQPQITPYPLPQPYPQTQPSLYKTPGDEDKNYDDEQNKYEKKVTEERMKRMKKNLQEFTRGIKQFESMIKKMEPRLTKLGVGIPAELKAAIAKAPEILEKIKNAQTPEELDDLVADIHDIGETMREWGQKFGDLMRLGEMLKQTDRQVKNLQKTLKRVQGYVKKDPSLKDSVDSLAIMTTSMTDAIKDAKELAKTDPDLALEKLEDEFFGRMEEFWNTVAQIDTIVNLNKGLRQASSEIAKAKRKIDSLKKSKKIDEETAQSLKLLITEIEEKVKEIKELSKNKADKEEIFDAAEQLWELVEEYENSIADISGESIYEPKVTNGQNVDFKLPDGFDFGPRDSGGFQGVDDGFNAPSPAPFTEGIKP